MITELRAISNAGAEISLYSVNSLLSLDTTENGTNTSVDQRFW